MTVISPYRFEQFFATRRLLSFTAQPDGERLLFVSDISGQFNLWRVATGGGWPEQLTLFDRESVREATISKDGARIAFLADLDGNEQYQIYLMDAEGGWPEQITTRTDVQYALGGFSPDGQYVAYSGNAAEKQDVDIFLRDLSTGEERMLTEGGGICYAARFSPDGQQLLAVQLFSNTDQTLWLIDVAGGERRELTPHAGRKAKHFPAFWAKDGKAFYFISDDGREFMGLARFDLASDTWEYVLTPDWDLEGASLSGDGQLLAYFVNEAGSSSLHVREMSTGTDLPLPTIPRGVIASVSFAGKDTHRRLFVQMGNYRTAGAIFVLDLEAGEFKAVSQSMLGNIPPEVFVEPELIHIPTFDGLKVPAWLYRPNGVESGAQVPALLAIHGGPEAQERPGYAYGGFFQYLLSQGVAILAPNIRGSTGFGLDYQTRIHRDWGGAELKDIEACAQYLQGQEWVASDRLGVWGGELRRFRHLERCLPPA